MKPVLGLIVFVVLGPVTMGCGEPGEESTPTHTVFGRLTSTAINTSGKDGVVKLVDPSQDILGGARYSTACAFSGPGCEYRIHWVLEGSYTAFAFVDMNENAAYDAPIPDSGDLITRGRALMLWENTELDFDDDAWHSMP